MISLARKYVAFGKASWSNMLEYRAQILLWMTGSLMMVVMLMVWLGIAADQATVGGFSAVDFTLYYMLGLVVRNMTAVWASWELDTQIREGTLSPQLLRPINPIHNHIAANWVEKTIRLAVTVPIAALVIALTPGAKIDLSLGALAALAVALLGAWAVAFFVDYLIGLTAFWTTQTSAFIMGFYGLRIVLSGTAAPMQLFPAEFQAALTALPFRYMLSFPLEIALNKLSPEQILSGLAIQWAWVTVFVLAVAVVWRLAIRSYSAVGA